MKATLVNSYQCFDGEQQVYTHHSEVTGVDMTFGLYLPPQAKTTTVPVLLYLSGLTCTWENVSTKSGIQRFAAEQGIAILTPDTSPRGDNVMDDAAFSLGQGASFYINATESPWRTHYQMYDYITQELLHVIKPFTLDLNRIAITGHSMGGHGALMIGLRNPNIFCAISAFSPIASIMQCPWGETALTHYLGTERINWQAYDVCHLMQATSYQGKILVDQGDADTFLDQQLKTPLLLKAAEDKAFNLQVNMREGYDHSYYFIASFMDNHIKFHAEQLCR